MSTHNHSRWQAIACDLDGTLLGRDLKVHPDDVAAVRQAQEAGLHVAICTGRNPVESFTVAHPLNLRGPGVFVNGSVIADMQTGRANGITPIGADRLDKLVEFFGSLGHAVLVLAVDPANGLPQYVITQHGKPHRATVEWLVANKMKAREQETIDPQMYGRIVRATIVVDVPESAEIEKRLAETFGDTIYSCSIYSGAYDCQVIEAFPPHINKWQGVLKLAAEINLDPARIVTVGDDINDIEMLQNASLSFAMGTASPAVQRCAKHVTGSQREGGVAQAIRQVLAQL